MAREWDYGTAPFDPAPGSQLSRLLDDGWEPIGGVIAPARGPDGAAGVVLVVPLRRRASPILRPSDLPRRPPAPAD